MDFVCLMSELHIKYLQNLPYHTVWYGDAMDDSYFYK